MRTALKVLLPMSAASYSFYRLGRRISRSRFVKRLLPVSLKSSLQRRLLARAVDHFPDRQYMLDVLLDAIISTRPRRVIDVGVQSYSSHYAAKFPNSCEYCTLDANPDVASLRGQTSHIVGSVLDIQEYFAPQSVDVVILNGILGFGIDDLASELRTFNAIATVLRKGGWLLVGWDRAPDGTPLANGNDPQEVSLEDPLNLDLSSCGYVHQAPRGLPPRVEFSDCAHVYDWFQSCPCG